MRLAILCDDGKVSAEFNGDSVKRELKNLLIKHDFDTAWDILVSELYNKLRSR